MNERIRLWVEVATALGKDPFAVVKCPECRVGTMFVKDELITDWNKLDRYIICNACKQYNVMTMAIPDNYQSPDDLVREFVEKQKKICKKYNAEFSPSHFNQIDRCSAQEF